MTNKGSVHTCLLQLFLILISSLISVSFASAATNRAAPDETSRSNASTLAYYMPYALELKTDCIEEALHQDLQELHETGLIDAGIIRNNRQLKIMAMPEAVERLEALPCIRSIESQTPSGPGTSSDRTIPTPSLERTVRGVQDLARETSGTAKLSLDRNTGVVRFVRFPLPIVTPSTPDLQLPTASVGQEFLERHGIAFGIQDPESELVLVSATFDFAGSTHLTFQQLFKDIPVFAGEIKVHLNSRRQITSANGTFVPDIQIASTEPWLSAAEAARIATSTVASQFPDTQLQALDHQLLVYRTGLAQGIPGHDHLVFEVEVSNASITVRELVYVDAFSGEVVDQITGIHTDLKRTISEAEIENMIWTEGNPDPIPVGWAGGSSQQVSDWQNEIDGAKEAYVLFANLSGGAHLSFDGQGATMSTINNDADMSCPNAYWNGKHTGYCTGVTGDDVVAHEWAHAYTENTNGLVYQYQPGALNESYSDIWGEVVDLINGRGADLPDNTRPSDTCSSNIHGANLPGKPAIDTLRWLMGEDASGFFNHPPLGNAIRDMWDPTCFGDPAKVNDKTYYCGTGDHGGVHINSGVPNHAFALLVDGGIYNGQEIAPLGLTKTTHIFWGAQNMLTAEANFGDQADALEAACANLIGSSLPALSTSIIGAGDSGESITTKDCSEIAKANSAVEFRTEECIDPLLGTIAGTVTAEGNGTPLPGVSVSAERYSHEFRDWEHQFYWPYKFARTDTDGRYHINNLVPGLHMIIFYDSSESYAGEYYVDVSDEGSVTDVHVVSGQISSAIDAVLKPTGRIRGRVLDDANGKPISDVGVDAYRYDSTIDGWRSMGWSTSDASGNFTISGLKPGTYRLQFRDLAVRYAYEYYGDSQDIANGTNILVASGETSKGIIARLGPAGHITGRVTDERNGAPLHDLMIQVYRCQEENIICGNYLSVDTDGNGEYDVPVSTGHYKLLFSDPRGIYDNYAWEYYNDEPNLATATEVYAVAGSITPNINAELGPSASIVGRVTAEADGASLKGITVTLFRQREQDGTWHYVANEFTDSAGWYEASPLLPGTYRMQFGLYSSEYLAEFYENAPTLQIAKDISVFAGTNRVDADLALAGHITGTVTDEATGLPVEFGEIDVRVLQRAKNGSDWEEIPGGALVVAGQYDYGGLNSGEYLVHFVDNKITPTYADEFYRSAATRTEAKSVTVIAGQTTEDINAVMNSAMIAGTVTSDADGSPLSGITVEILRYEDKDKLWEWQGDAMTDVDGHYRVGGLEPGDYRVLFAERAVDYVPEYYGDSSNLSEATNVPVPAGGIASGIDTSLAPAGHIEGTIRADQDGSLLSGICTEALIYQSDDQTWRTARSNFTDNHGRYDLGALAAGSYRLRFYDRLGVYAGEYYDDVLVPAVASDLSVSAGQRISRINASLALLTPPENDDFENATVIDGLPYYEMQLVQAASTGENDPELPCGPTGTGKRSVWFVFTPQSDMKVSISTANSDYDTNLALWKEVGSALNNVDCNDNFGATDQSQLTSVPLEAHVRYYIEVTSRDGAAGGLLLSMLRETEPTLIFLPVIRLD